MAVPVDGFSVVVRCQTLAESYPGGVDGFRDDCPNKTFCTDGRICRVGFMTGLDVGDFLDRLAAAGLHVFANGQFRDVAVVTQQEGLDHPCAWLRLGRHRSGVLAVWLEGTKPGRLVGPEGWTPECSLERVSHEEARDRLRFLRVDGSVDVFFDTQSQREVYVGRTQMVSEDESHPDYPGRSAHELYEWGVNLVSPYMPYQSPPADATDSGRRELVRGLKLLTCVVKLDPENWSAWWIRGLGLRALGRHEAEYKSLRRAYRLKPDHKDVLREYCLACMTVARGKEAARVGWEATELDPHDAGLVANLGLALLVAGDVAQAESVVRRSLAMRPEDAITQNLLGYIEAVRDGHKPCPTRFPPE